MKPAKWLVLGALALALSFATSAFGQECDAKVSCGNTARFASGPDAGSAAVCVHPGTEVYYTVTVGLGLNDCPIINGEVSLEVPDGRILVLDTDCNLPPNGSVTYDVRDRVPSWTNYIVDCADGPSHSECAALSVISGGPPVPVTGTGEWNLFCLQPCIDVTKTPDTDISKAGDTVIYTICVTNCTVSDDPAICDPTLHNVQVDDPLLTPIYGWPLPGFPSELAPGQEVCVDFEYLVPPGAPDPLINVATAKGVDAEGTQVQDSNDAVVDLVEPNFTVEKICPEVTKVGDEACYTIIITNTGETDLEIVDVNDSLCALTNCIGEVLPPGGQCIDECCYLVPADAPNPLVNSVTVTVVVPVLGNRYTKSDSCESILVNPAIDIEKTVDNPNPCYGDTVTYTICIENTGDWPLDNVEVTDPDLGIGPLPGFPPLLFPGEVYCVDFPYLVQDDDPCPLVNTATVTANALDLGNPLEDSDDAEICPEPCGGVFCTFTQGYYGNPGGKKCGGMSTTAIINAALKVGGPVVVGVPGRSITFDSAACIINRLPAGGTPSALPVGLGNANCGSLPGSLIKKNKPEINNVLVGQVVALTLNLRLFDIDCTEDIGDLGAWTLPATFCTVSNDGCPKKWTVPATFVGMTVQELLDLANDTLGGVPDTMSPSAVNNAVTLINEAFDECAEVISCPAEEICGNGCDDDFDGLINEGCI